MSFNSVTSQSLGDLRDWDKNPAGISAQTTFGNFRVVVYSESIFRITATTQTSFDDFSYSVIASPDGKFDIRESEDAVVISTSKCSLSVNKFPVRFTFLNKNGEIINEDDVFGVSWNNTQATAYKKLQDGERFIGLGEKTGPLDRRGHGYTNWNTDAYAYSPGADPLYCSTPFYIGLHHNIVYGIFLDNTHKSFFNFGASNNRFSSFAVDDGDMNYYLIHGDSVADIIREYTHLTGRMPLPPRWSIGYQQCRYSYYPDKEVLSVAETFREKDIPADTIVLDIHYMDQYKIFTWSKKDFPDPKSVIDELQQLGFHVVVMCDPGIKVEEGYETYEDGVKNDVFIKYPDGTYYTGQVWPGWCHFPDFTNPKAREWWKEKFKSYVELGIDGFWNDMNEIATWGHMMPENVEMDFEGNVSTFRRGRNVYGFQMSRSTYEGTKKLLDGKRPFNLTRSGFSGIQRYAAVWTGDNVAYDEHMILGIRMVSSMGLAGIAFAGYDVGGFVGEANGRLFARWLSIGAFSPFFRGHTMINTRDSEPWSYGEEIEQISRNYIKLRYRLLPYLYSLFHEASVSGMPVQRSLAIDYPFNARVYDGRFQNQYLFGPFILVAPVESDKAFTKVYFPPGVWYSIYDGKQYDGDNDVIVESPIQRLPVFIKGGAIIPMQRAMSNTSEQPDTIDLHLYNGDGTSSFNFYDDDGSTFDYVDGKFELRSIILNCDKHVLTIRSQNGSLNSTIKKWRLVMHGFGETDRVTVNGKALELTIEQNKFFEQLEKFDPIIDPEPAPLEKVQVVSFDHVKEAIEVKW